jgi:hypothetical protein
VFPLASITMVTHLWMNDGIFSVTPVTGWVVRLHIVLSEVHDASNFGATDVDPVYCDASNFSISGLSS